MRSFDIRTSLIHAFDLPSRSYHGAPHQLGHDLIITLTSYPGRFETLPYTLECLFKQSIQPDLIVLWIAENDKDEVPEHILDLAKPGNRHGFEIRYCQDWKSYKKIIPSLIEFPEAILVTADDDLFYGYHWLRHLVEGWDGNHKNAVCRRAHGIRLNQEGYPLPYTQWAYEVSGLQKGENLFPTSGAGVLFPPGSLSQEVNNSELFQQLAGSCDDVWLYWMLRRAGSIAVKTEKSMQLIDWPSSQASGSLFKANFNNGGNDKAIAAMIHHFGWPEHIESYPYLDARLI